VPSGATRLTFVPPAAQAQLSAPVVVNLQVEGASDLAAVPIRVKWDPKILRLNQVTPGSLMVQNGGVSPPSLDIRNDAGEASIELTRVAGAAGVNGSGPLMQFTFTAVGQGTTTLSVTSVALRGSKQQPIAVAAPSVSVTVQ
jgi:hypothetical protein